MTLTSERLAELERASANCVRRGHPEWVLDVRADELAALCRATRLAALLAKRCRALEGKLAELEAQENEEVR